MSQRLPESFERFLNDPTKEMKPEPTRRTIAKKIVAFIDMLGTTNLINDISNYFDTLHDKIVQEKQRQQENKNKIADKLDISEDNNT